MGVPGRAVWLVAVAVSACGGGDGEPQGTGGSLAGGSGGSAGTGTVAGVGGGGTGSIAGSTTSGGSAGTTGSVDPFMGVADDCQKFMLPLQNAPRSLTSFHTNAEGAGFDVGTAVLTFKDGLFYVVENDLLKTIDLEGTVMELGPVAEGNPTVIGDYYHFSEVSATDDTKVDHCVSPFLMPEQKTQLAQTESGLIWQIGEGSLFWEKRGEEAAIWSAPLAGGDGAVLVPGGEPTGMAVDGGYLYWTDFETSQLERVPVAGGAREALGEISFGGLMSAGFGAYYWRGPTGQLYRFKVGGQEEHVFVASTGHEAQTPVPVEGGAYFQAGSFSCRELYYLPLSGEPELLLSGFEENARIVGMTTQHLYVQDANAIYRLAR